MKKLLTVVFTMLLASSLAFAQAAGGTPATTKATGKKATKTSKAHKGGKKGKKSTGTGTTAPAPK